ncbi:unnamed protein product [Penicillium pancosmium]
MGHTKPNDFVTVKTSLPTSPLPTNHARSTLTTDRLLLQPLAASDLEAIDKLNNFLPPNDTKTFNYAICLKETGEFIGMGGCHLFPAEHGWPEVGYMLKKEFWGQGLASEFLNAWLRAWKELPRSERESNVAREMVNSEGSVQEHLIAITEEANSGSQRVLLKAGFEKFREFDEEDVSQPDGIIKLIAFRYFPSREDL